MRSEKRDTFETSKLGAWIRNRSIPSASLAGALLLAACGAQVGDEGQGAGTGGSSAGGATGGTGSPSGGAGPSTGGAPLGSGGTVGASGGTVGASGGTTSGSGGAGAAAGTEGNATGGTAGTSTNGTDGGAPGSGGTDAGGGSAGSSTGSGGSGGAISSTGCGKAPPSSSRYSIDVNGTTREYILFVPANYDRDRPYRLVFAWHPLGGSAQQTAGNGNGGYYGLQGASSGQAILVSPEGLQQNGNGNRGWWNTGGGDIAFLRAMLDRFKSELCIDESRIFSTGFSFGGMMSFSVGCTGLVRAIAPMAGNPQVSGCTNGTQPVAMMGFHGTEDTVVAINGGRQGRDIFVQRNQCTQQTTPASPNWCDGVSAGNQPCSCVSYQGCAAGYPVTWCEFNAGHTPAPNSATTIWNFFAQF